MSTNIIEIKQSPDLSAQSVGLAKYNRSKMPGCWEILQAGIGRDGRWITGLDEKSIAIKQIGDPEVREKTQKEVQARRESLELLTGYDLSADSKNTHWERAIIKLSDKTTLDLNNPNDVITYHLLLANNFAAPEIAVTDTPDFVNSKFYMSRTEEEAINISNRTREKDKAISKLFSMYDNKNRLTLVAKYVIGASIKDTMSVDTLYNTVSSFIKDPEDKKGSNVRKFLEAADKTIEDLNYRITAIEAIKLNILRQREGLYQRGNITYGKDINKVTEFLADPKNSLELESIIEEIREKKIYG